MNKIVRRMIGYLLATLTTFMIASIAHTQFVLNELASVGVDINMSIRIDSALSDLVDLAPGYGSILALGLLLAFVVMSTIRNRYSTRERRVSYWVYPIGGLLAVICIHFAMDHIFDITLIAGARSFWGYLWQCFAGFVGGYVYLVSIKYLRRYRKGRTRHHPVRKQLRTEEIRP
ncbi:hypothetical protein [Neptunicella sp. SCSIO 80796]|uniref:hypothetical protein n=1 Tax=Neptunicella plasticusilytica TaxID=3117012 RepID=UPI003A4D90B9